MTDAKESLSPGGYSGVEYWDAYHEEALTRDIDRAVKLKLWLESLLPLLKGLEDRRVLDLGCGSGHDAVALSRQGFQVSGCDISGVAIEEARALARRQGQAIELLRHDIATPLPYADATFSAVICNLTLHMFTPETGQGVTAEVKRCLEPGGLFAFHVNSTEDLPYRRKLQPPVRRLENGMYCLGRGQTMRFFSEADCRDLLQGWELVLLQPAQMLREDGAVQKCAWRCAARKPFA